jgi:hypothetical protein
MRRAYAFAIACLASTAAYADVPVPAPNPFVDGPAVVDSGCPEGTVPANVALGVIESQTAQTGEPGAFVAGALANQMRAALSTVTEKPVVEVTSIVVMPIRGPDGQVGQMWVLFANGCSPAVAILPPPVVAAVWKLVNSTI